MDLINDYNNEYNNILKSNEDKIITAFIIYYGAQYKDLISDRIKSITYAYFRHRSLDELYDITKDYLINADDIKSCLKYNINKVFGSSKSLDNTEKQYIKKVLDNSPNLIAVNITIYNIDKFNEIILLPMFFDTDEILFHELNHIIVRNNLINIEENGNNTLIRKDGLDINSKYTYFEEILNELSAREITKIFHKIYGKIFDTVFRIGNDYEKFFPIVEPFYYKYKDIIRRSRISLNYNELFAYINKDVFYLYIDFINKIVIEFEKYNQLNKKFILDSSLIKEANKFVEKMGINNEKRLKLVKY